MKKDAEHKQQLLASQAVEVEKHREEVMQVDMGQGGSHGCWLMLVYR